MDSKHLDVALPGQGMSNVAQNQKYCTRCSTTETTEWVTDLEGKVTCIFCLNYFFFCGIVQATDVQMHKTHIHTNTSLILVLFFQFLCNNCGISGKSGSESHLGSNTCNEKGNEEVRCGEWLSMMFSSRNC